MFTKFLKWQNLQKLLFIMTKNTVNNFKKLPEAKNGTRIFLLELSESVNKCKKSVESATRCQTKTKHFKKLVKSKNVKKYNKN